MAMYSVCAASQDWVIEDLVRGRIENLVFFCSEESKLRISFPLQSIIFTGLVPVVIIMLNCLRNANVRAIYYQMGA